MFFYWFLLHETEALNIITPNPCALVIQEYRCVNLREVKTFQTIKALPEKLNKAEHKGKNDNSSKKIIHLTENELIKLVKNMLKKATKLLEAEIKELNTKLNELVEGQNFVSDRQGKMANEYKNVLTKCKKQKENTKKLKN